MLLLLLSLSEAVDLGGAADDEDGGAEEELLPAVA